MCGISPVSLLELTSLKRRLNRRNYTVISSIENCSISRKINLQLLQIDEVAELPSKIPSEI